MAQVLKYHGRRLQHVILSGSLVFSSSSSFSPPLARFYHRMFLWHAEKQRGSLARIPSCASMGRCQGGQFTSALSQIYFLIFSYIYVVIRFLDLWSMRNLVLLLTYFLLVLPLIAT